MSWLSTLKRHLAISGGDFSAIFQNLQIPPLPQAAMNMQRELEQPEPDMARLAKIITADVGLSSRVLRIVNSSFYGLSNPIRDLQHAVSMLGLMDLQKLTLALAVQDTVSKTASPLFVQEAFWADSLLKALLSRDISRGMGLANADEAFTISLLADIAVPVLLTGWSEYYTPVIERWNAEPGRLSRFELETFGWEHAAAGAWILESWNFPEQICTLVGAHDLSTDEIRRLELDKTIALPIVLAAQLPTTMHNVPVRRNRLVEDMHRSLDFSPERMSGILTRVEEQFADISILFGLASATAPRGLAELRHELETGAKVDV